MGHGGLGLHCIAARQRDTAMGSSANCHQRPEQDSSKVIFPRRKRGRQREQGCKAIVVTKEILQTVFHMPLHLACKKLGVCATALKKACRKLGIRKWPFRDQQCLLRRTFVPSESSARPMHTENQSSEESEECSSGTESSEMADPKVPLHRASWGNDDSTPTLVPNKYAQAQTREKAPHQPRDDKTQLAAAANDDETSQSVDVDPSSSSFSHRSASVFSSVLTSPAHDSANIIFPRRKQGQQREQGRKGIAVTMEILETVFHMPLHKACKKLGVCATALKRACRKLGVHKWPYRDLHGSREQRSTGPSQEERAEENASGELSENSAGMTSGRALDCIPRHPIAEAPPCWAPAVLTILPDEELLVSASRQEDFGCLKLPCPEEGALEDAYASWGLPFPGFLSTEEWQAEAKDGGARTVSMSTGLLELAP